MTFRSLAPESPEMALPAELPELAVLLVRRLRARPDSAWSHGTREDAMRTALQQLADRTAGETHDVARVVPDIGVAALADQLAVLIRDAIRAGATAESVAGILEPLARSLAVQ